MRKFSEQVHISISSFSQNVIYYDLQLSQRLAEYHFSLLCGSIVSAKHKVFPINTK